MKNLVLVAKITRDNRRPGMKYPDGWLIRYNPHPDHGWLSCKTVATREEAATFAAAQEAEEANARLIAAAPELLDACRALLAVAEGLNFPAAAQARAAIDRAEGGLP